MDYYKRMNAKMDAGYKLTDMPCDGCKTNWMIHPQTKLLYCPKCDKAVDEPVQIIMESTQQDDSENDAPAIQEDEQQVMKDLFSRKSTSDQVSVKLGNYLMQGWAMLAEVCPDCLIPIMRSKQGKTLCVGCDNAYQDKKEPQQEAKQETQVPPPSVQQFPLEGKPSAQQTKKDQPPPPQQIREQKAPQKPQPQNQSNIAPQQILEDSKLKILKFYQKKLDEAIDDEQENEIERYFKKIKDIVQN